MTDESPVPQEVDPLKLPKHPKYASVSAVVDTGRSFPAVFKDVDLSKLHARFSREESFRRLSCRQFLQLLSRVDEVGRTAYSILSQ